MNKPSCFDVVDIAVSHFADEFQVTKIDDECLIITPFLFADSSPIEIFVDYRDNNLLLTDEGETFNQLFVSGLTIENNNELYKLARTMANQNGVEILNSKIYTITNVDGFGASIQRLATTLQAVSYLIYKRIHRSRLKFDDEVEKSLITSRVQYENRHSLHGYASTHLIPFYVNSGKNILIQPVTANTIHIARNKAKTIGYQWADLQRKYQEHYRYNVVVDTRAPSSEDIWKDQDAMAPLINYSTNVYFWKQDQEKFISDLVRS